jgi:dienelactone hydrolase
MKKILVLALLFFSLPLQAKVIGEEVSYEHNGVTFKGYIAYDNSVMGKRPGVLVVHEWWGHNAYARKRADMLAELGYTALALDMYGEGKQAHHPKDAGAFSAAVKANMAEAEGRFMAAYEVLANHKTVNKKKIAAIGYCFGGQMVLEMARRGVDLKGVVSFHGSLVTNSPAQKGKVKAKVLVLNGAADPFVKPEQIQAFEAEMKAAAVDYRIHHYPGAKHAFTNPQATEYGQKFGIPLAYNAAADEQSWAEMKKFLKSIF